MSEHWGWLEHYRKIQEAINEGYQVIWSNDKLLLLDLDSEESIDVYRENIKNFGKSFALGTITEWESKSGPGHLHVSIELFQPMQPAHRIIAELYLGSDRKRGLCQLRDILEQPNASVLFKPKKKEETNAD